MRMIEEYTVKSFYVRKLLSVSELDGTSKTFWSASYRWDSEWHTHELFSSEREVLNWVDEQHESEDFQEWEKKIWQQSNF